MNGPSIFTVIVGVVIAAGVLMFGQGGGVTPPAPPDDVIVAPELEGIAKQARESADDFPVRLAENLREAKQKLASGELKDENAARAWLAEENGKDRKAAFHGWHLSLDKAIESGVLPNALEESAVGFDAAGKSK